MGMKTCFQKVKECGKKMIETTSGLVLNTICRCNKSEIEYDLAFKKKIFWLPVPPYRSEHFSIDFCGFPFLGSSNPKKKAKSREKKKKEWVRLFSLFLVNRDNDTIHWQVKTRDGLSNKNWQRIVFFSHFFFVLRSQWVLWT